MQPHTPLKFLHNPDVGMLIIRIGVGVVGVYHGGQKLGFFGGGGIQEMIDGVTKMGFPMPTVSAWAAALSELGGGLLVALGLIPRIGAMLFALTMLVAWGKVHKFSFDHNTGGSDYPFFIMLVCLGLVFTGPGRYSLMALMNKPRAA